MSDNIMHEKDIQKTSLRQKMVFIPVQVLLYAFLLVMAVIVLFPFYWMIISSLKTLDEYRMSVPTFFPKRVMFSNYAQAFTSANLGRLFMNTLYVGVVSTILSLIITILSAFAFARLEFKGKNALFAALEYWNGGFVYNDKKNGVAMLKRFQQKRHGVAVDGE